MNCNPILPWDFCPAFCVYELDAELAKRNNSIPGSFHDVQGHKVYQGHQAGAKKCKQRANTPVICPRSAIKILQALIVADGVSRENRNRFEASIVAWQMYSILPTRRPSDVAIVKSDTMTKEAALLEARRDTKDIIFLDLQSKALYFIVMHPEERPYGGYLGVLRHSPTVFDAFNDVDSFYLPFGIFAPLAAVVHRPEDVEFRVDGSVFGDDVDEIIQTMFDTVTFADPKARKVVDEAVKCLKGCQHKYFPCGGLLSYLRHCVVMEAFFGINLTRSQHIALSVRRCHHVNDETVLQHYIHSSILVGLSDNRFKFGSLPVVTIRRNAPRDYRFWVTSVSNDANSAAFPELGSVVNDFQFLDFNFNLVLMPTTCV